MFDTLLLILVLMLFIGPAPEAHMKPYEHHKRGEDEEMVLYGHDKQKRDADEEMVLYGHDKQKRDAEDELLLYDHHRSFNADFADK